MIRMIFYALLLIAGAFGAARLAQHPGDVVLNWDVWRVETSAAFLLFAFIAASAVLALLLLFLRALWHFTALALGIATPAPTPGVEIITRALTALAVKDASLARKHTRALERKIGKEAPLTLLLGAQVATLEGREDEAKQLLEKMSEIPLTRTLAARGLSEYHARHDAALSALPHAARAASLLPKDSAALRTLVGTAIKLKRWPDAFAALKHARGPAKNEAKHLFAVIRHAEAAALASEGNIEAAYASALLGTSHEPGFVPLAALAARLAARTGQMKEALRILKKSWHVEPHPVLAQALLDITQDMPPDKRWKAVKAVVHAHRDSEEGHLLLAEVALKRREFTEARAELRAALQMHESRRACGLMAKLEEMEYQDSAAASRWRAREQSADVDPLWVCRECTHTELLWATHCQACFSFDSFRWARQRLNMAAA